MILIVGAGAVGTILCAYLGVAKREPVKLYVREKDVDALQAVQNVRVEHAGAAAPPIVAPKPVLTRSLDLDGVSYLIICVKYPQLDPLLDAIGRIPRNCTVVSTLNGVGALHRIRERFADAQLTCMSVMFNAQLLEPLHAQITTRPHILLGCADSRLENAFAGSGMLVQRVEGETAAWGKLLINLANAVCALTRTTFKDLLTDRDLRAIYVELLDEAAAVLDRARIPFRLPMPLGYRPYRWLLGGRSPLPWWFARYGRGLQEGAYPSMVADVEAGRTTEIDQLNGEIVRLGAEYDVPTPVNATIVRLIGELGAPAASERFSPTSLRRRLGL